MRSFLLSPLLSIAVVLGAASCTAPPPPPLGDVFAPFLPPVELAALGPIYLPSPAAAWERYRPRPPGRLTLSNFRFESTHVEAAVSPYADCTPAEGAAPVIFELPLNATRVLVAPGGLNICWRRELRTERGTPPLVGGGWSPWQRAYTSPGRYVDTRI